MFEVQFGLGRTIGARKRVALSAHAAVGIASHWRVTHDDGQLRATDAADLAAVEMSWIGFGASPGAPSASARLRRLLDVTGHRDDVVAAIDRGDRTALRGTNTSTSRWDESNIRMTVTALIGSGRLGTKPALVSASIAR